MRNLYSMLRVPVLLVPGMVCGCTAAPPPPPPPGLESLPAPDLPIDLRLPAIRAREALERILGRTVPEDAARPVVASRAEMEACLSEELRPQVNFLHPHAPESARETLLRATASASARAVLARYSPARKRILVTLENLPAQARASGLPGDRATLRALATQVLAHEMVHAIDDADHDLAALFHAVPDAEALRALGMVVEGRAVHYARLAGAAMELPAEVVALLPGAGGDLDERRARFLLSYGEGAAFIADLEKRGGHELAALPLRRPPRSTSTLFHPLRFGPNGEEPPPDMVARMVKAGYPEAGAASELDLRARWLPVLGAEGVARAFSGFRAGAGLHRDGGGVSLSVHETPDAATAYASALALVQAPLLEALEAEGIERAQHIKVLGSFVAASVAATEDAARAEVEALLND